MKFLISLFVFIILLIFVSTEEDETEMDTRITSYLKQCGFLNSLKTTKCVLASRKIKSESKKIAASKKHDLSKLQEACKSTVSCLQDLKCRPAEEDHKDTINFCWRANFEQHFAECRQKLRSIENSEEGSCLKQKARTNIKGEVTQTERCNWLRESKTCMLTNTEKQCGKNKSNDWLRYSSELYTSNDCLKLTGLQFDSSKL
ncbi:unnamed protein product [Caenorhabditis angaria]|uniref:T20D4.11-like domain-containing protein n=1 Tax=Caenorhabditis angaria TaxID=860376 RepID=A0A9P1IX73_9PELO|nr:unnamed protein product [Caenorhabditis angaria]